MHLRIAFLTFFSAVISFSLNSYGEDFSQSLKRHTEERRLATVTILTRQLSEMEKIKSSAMAAKNLADANSAENQIKLLKAELDANETKRSSAISLPQFSKSEFTVGHGSENDKTSMFRLDGDMRGLKFAANVQGGGGNKSYGEITVFDESKKREYKIGEWSPDDLVGGKIVFELSQQNQTLKAGAYILKFTYKKGGCALLVSDLRFETL